MCKSPGLWHFVKQAEWLKASLNHEKTLAVLTAQGRDMWERKPWWEILHPEGSALSLSIQVPGLRFYLRQWPQRALRGSAKVVPKCASAFIFWVLLAFVPEFWIPNWRSLSFLFSFFLVVICGQNMFCILDCKFGTSLLNEFSDFYYETVQHVCVVIVDLYGVFVM